MTRIALALLAAACSPAAFYPAHPSTAHQLAALRSDDGACADQWLESTYIRACAHTGAPHTLADSDKPFLVTTWSADTFPSATPSNWLVIVTGPDGKELLRQRGKESVPDVGLCNQHGCTKRDLDVIEMPAAWSPGIYRIRYICSFDTRRVVDLSITLAAAQAKATR